MATVQKKANACGFTLLELLISMSLTGILAAIALPQYASYREKAYDSQAEVALRTVATAEEAYYSTHYTYKSCDHTNCSTILEPLDPINTGVLLDVVAAPDSFTASASHLKGSGAVYNWP